MIWGQSIQLFLFLLSTKYQFLIKFQIQQSNTIESIRIMSNDQFVITIKKRISIKPFFDVFQAKHKSDQNNNYFVEIYNLTKLEDEKIKQALEYNQCIFTDKFELPTSNIVKILKVDENQSFSAYFVEKYDKNLQQFIRDRKKGRLPQQLCIMIMEDILKGLATILEAGYRPVSIRADNVVRCFSKNPEQRPQIWKVKNVVYSSTLNVEQQHFLTFEQNYSPPQIYSRRNCKDIEYEQSQEYTNALLVWSLGIIFAKLLGIEGKLDTKKKLSEFRDREFNVLDILYIRNEYSIEFLRLVASMLHFDNKKRMKLKDLFNQPIFSPDITKAVKKMSIPIKISQIKKAVDQVWKVDCKLFQFNKLF